MSATAITGLTVRRGGRVPLSDATIAFRPGEFTGLIGPNGAGKTTLLRAMLGLLPAEGRSTLADLSPTDRARRVAWLPQRREIAWPVDVETVVALGRIPHLPRGARLSADDRAAVDRAIARMDLNDLRHRTATELSGGEQARVLIARLLAQETRVIFADEPIAGLDPAAQIATMRVFADAAKGGATVVVSLHDLGLAVRHCDRLVLMNDGQIAADGPPGAVMTRETLARVFGIAAHFTQTADGPVFQPLETV